jgi:hypothetical protein
MIDFLGVILTVFKGNGSSCDYLWEGVSDGGSDVLLQRLWT